MVSIKKDAHQILDGASQIATMATGFNDPSKQSLEIRDEVYDSTLNLMKWDVTVAYKNLLTKESGLPHAYFVNSGSEAVETAIRGFQIKYPGRKKILAFEGSFVTSQALRTVERSLILHKNAALNAEARKSLNFESRRFYPEMIDWVAQTVGDLIAKQSTVPSEIAVLAPYLSDSMRFSLVARLEAAWGSILFTAAVPRTA